MDVRLSIDEEIEKFFKGFAYTKKEYSDVQKVCKNIEHVVEGLMQTKHNIHLMIIDLEQIRAFCMGEKEPVKKEVPKAAVPKGPVKKTPRMVQPVKKKK